LVIEVGIPADEKSVFEFIFFDLPTPTGGMFSLLNISLFAFYSSMYFIYSSKSLSTF